MNNDDEGRSVRPRSGHGCMPRKIERGLWVTEWRYDQPGLTSLQANTAGSVGGKGSIEYYDIQRQLHPPHLHSYFVTCVTQVRYIALRTRIT